MCFSNLPIEFDDDGNPYLADEADDVERPAPSDAAPESNCGCSSTTDDVALDEADPEAMYEAILQTVPRDVRERLAEASGGPDRTTRSERSERGRTGEKTTEP